MNWQGVPETQGGIKFDLWNLVQVSTRYFLGAEKSYRIAPDLAGRVAGKAKRVSFGTRLGPPFGGMRIMAHQALAALIGTVKHRALLLFMAQCAQVSARGGQGYGCLVLFRGYSVAFLATHPHGGVDELASVFSGMAGQAGFGLDILLLDEGMIDGLFGGDSMGWQGEASQKQKTY
jgi:hypothetical protein